MKGKPLGVMFKYKGRILETVKRSEIRTMYFQTCAQCALTTTICSKGDVLYCSKDERKDKQSVCFKQYNIKKNKKKDKNYE